MALRRDLTGKRYGRLLILSLNRTRSHTYWNCRCDCGKEIVAESYNISSGHTTSCGCYQSELIKKRNTIHGLTNHVLHGSWCKIIERCYTISSHAYKDYGGRGIKVCTDWLTDFKKFYDWSIANGWNENVDIDRINNDGDYEPSNCRYVHPRINCYNRRVTVKYEYNGKMLTGLDFENMSKEIGANLGCHLIMARLQDGWTVEKAISEPINMNLSHKKIKK